MLDVWLESEEASSEITITTNHGNCTYPLNEIGFHELSTACGGMDKTIQVNRLPNALSETHLKLERKISLREQEDTRLFVRVFQEDGHRAWSSPIYLFKKT